MGGWKGGKAGLRIAYSNQRKKACWMDGRMDGWKGEKAGLRIAYSNQKSHLYGKALEFLNLKSGIKRWFTSKIENFSQFFFVSK